MASCFTQTVSVSTFLLSEKILFCIIITTLVGEAKLHDFISCMILALGLLKKKHDTQFSFAFWFTYTKIVQLGAPPTSGYFACHTAVELTVRKAIICR